MNIQPRGDDLVLTIIPSVLREEHCERPLDLTREQVRVPRGDFEALLKECRAELADDFRAHKWWADACGDLGADPVRTHAIATAHMEGMKGNGTTLRSLACIDGIALETLDLIRPAIPDEDNFDYYDNLGLFTGLPSVGVEVAATGLNHRPDDFPTCIEELSRYWVHYEGNEVGLREVFDRATNPKVRRAIFESYVLDDIDY